MHRNSVSRFLSLLLIELLKLQFEKDFPDGERQALLADHEVLVAERRVLTVVAR